LLVILGTAGALGLLWLVVVVAPPWFVQGRDDLEDAERLRAENDVRTTLLQGLAGAVLGIGAYFTYRQLRTDREGQITERYTRAIDQIGKQDLEIRLGGIYALERIARDSRADRTTIGDVLAAFVRSYTLWPGRSPEQSTTGDGSDRSSLPWLRLRAPDVQACLTVLGRGGFAKVPEGLLSLNYEEAGLLDYSNPMPGVIDLGFTDLRGAHLGGAHLEGGFFYFTKLDHAVLEGAHLDWAILNNVVLDWAQMQHANMNHAIGYGISIQNAHLENTQLKGAILQGRLCGSFFINADLEGAFMFDANLGGAQLAESNLKDAVLRHADLERADLRSANLTNAKLYHASLKGADLRGANMEGAEHLDSANLAGAKVNDTTTWPRGFNWQAAGAIRTYTVHVDVQPGQYRVTPDKTGTSYWARLGLADEVIDSNISEEPSIVDVQPGDVLFQFTGYLEAMG
jgi:uncharacterized protein YjbI with pentapeptide repeats